jgi:hypothetical protein
VTSIVTARNRVLRDTLAFSRRDPDGEFARRQVGFDDSPRQNDYYADSMEMADDRG